MIKLKKDVSTSLIAIIVLSIMLIASIVIGLTLAYYNEHPKDLANNNTPIILSAVENSSEVTNIIVSSKNIHNGVLNKTIVITPSNTENNLIRVKVSVNNNNKTINLQLNTTNDWIKDENNYYYYNSTIHDEGLILTNTINIPKTLKPNIYNDYVFNVVVESISSHENLASKIWNNSPTNWLYNNLKLN